MKKSRSRSWREKPRGDKQRGEGGEKREDANPDRTTRCRDENETCEAHTEPEVPKAKYDDDGDGSRQGELTHPESPLLPLPNALALSRDPRGGDASIWLSFERGSTAAAPC